jgi:predicted AAA+ superfamily ATPase
VNKETLKYVLAQSATRPFPPATPRTLQLPLDPTKIVSLVAERSLRKQAVNPKKMHTIDWALAQPFVAEPTVDLGRRLETAVFLEWRRRREDLGYLAGDREVDLVVNRERPEQLINVAYSVAAQETWSREIAALEHGRTRFPRAKRLLVTHEHAFRTPPAGVDVVDAWRYLLGAPPG